MEGGLDDHCFMDKTRESQVSVIRMPYTDAKGPCIARALCQTLWQQERYYLQIDSHMRFIRHWDTILIDMLARCPSPKAVLTGYPMGYTLPNNIPPYTYPTLLVANNFGADNMLRLGAKLANKPKLSEPVPSLFWIAGFSFSLATMIQEVPYDPHLEHLFFGEEMLMSTRLWTSGYDLYCPTHAIIFHLWKRDHRPTFREVGSTELAIKQKQQSIKRLKVILRMVDNNDGDLELAIEDKYNIGQQRTLEQYQEYCGVDFRQQTITERAKRGGYDEALFLNPIMELAIKSQQGLSV
ncbi:hypothetical protein SAMD00019534_093390 [Acytostelium subglobosum LB1]|uniref:hypothetical protein n=1 Tax=Acytostelium subglobosum LB1 TaxID=1410327 RepID=UPI000644BCD8|nr:hypothetical protein SAMD00019534_093390 [Acytostelium subglobosum LB1]GAM26164.1 hypothetical protein SAMD00019534_093390 [Acytostelium subglobosum LB1]|eukprot:XP_012750718.1 hypothetical protein SAMD00019534_093390 [Acytostelium subglobosum LB1]